VNKEDVTAKKRYATGHTSRGCVLEDLGLSKSEVRRLKAEVVGPTPARKKSIVKAAVKKHEAEMLDRYKKHTGLTKTLLANIKARMPELEKLLAGCSSHWGYEDPVYRLYHGSYKVFGLQDATLQIVEELRTVAPDGFPLNADFLQIVDRGTKAGEFRLEYNKDWHRHAGPVVEAFFHARYFLEMAVKYGRELDEPPDCLPSGWASVLYLYNLR